MGLDMYLYCNSKRVCQEVNDPNDTWEGGYQAPHGIAVYWRKANAIHNWFVTEIQGGNDDCGIYEVEIEELAKLHDMCKAVLESTELVDAQIQNGTINGMPNMVPGQKLADDTTARLLLPTREGFFFGDTDYDQWYWNDLQYTVDKLGKLMENLTTARNRPCDIVHKDEPDWVVRFYYTSSW